MRWFKTTLLAAASLCLPMAALIAVAVFAFDDDHYRRLAIRSVRFFTGYHVDIEGPFALDLSSEPSLSAEAIRFSSPPGQPPLPAGAIGKLVIRVALWPLLRGRWVIRDLLLENVGLTIAAPGEEAAARQRTDTGRSRTNVTIPVIENARLADIRLDVTDASGMGLLAVQWQRLSIEGLPDSGALFIRGEGAVSGTEFELNGQMGAPTAVFKGAEPYPMALDFRSEDFSLSASGTVDDLFGGKGLAFHLVGETGDLSRLLHLLGIEAPRLGALRAEATLTRDLAAPGISDLSVSLSNGSGLELVLSGSVDNAASGAGADLVLAGSCTDPDVIAWLLPGGLPSFNQLRVAGTLKESQGNFSLENIRFKSAGPGPVQLTSHGRIGQLPRRDGVGPPVSRIDLETTLEAAGTRFVGAHFGLDLPEMGALSLRARIHGSSDRLELTELHARTDSAQGVTVDAVGRVGVNMDAESGLRGSVELATRVAAPSLKAFFSLFGTTDLPDLEPFRAGADVRGSFEELSLSGLSVEIGQSRPVRLSLSGDIGRIPLGGDPPMSGVDLKAVLSAESAAGLGRMLGLDLPDMGPLKAGAHIRDRNGVYGLQNLHLVAGRPNGGRLKVTGGIASMAKGYDLDIDGLDLTAESENLPVRLISDLLGGILPDLGLLSGRARIRGNPKNLAVSSLDLATAASQGLTTRTTGVVRRIRMEHADPLSGVDVSMTASAQRLSALPGTAGLNLPNVGPVQVKAVLADRSGSLDIESFEIVSASTAGDLMHLRGKIIALNDPLEMALTAAIETTSRPWVATYMNRPQAVNERLTGSVTVIGQEDGLRVVELALATADNERLTLKGRGRLLGLAETPTVDMEIELSAPDVPALGSMLGISLPAFGPLVVEGRVTGNRQRVDFSGQSRLGETVFHSTISTALEGSRPRIDARVSADTIHLKDIGIFSGPRSGSLDSTSSPPPRSSRRVFENTPLPLDALRDQDLYLTLDAQKLVGPQIAIENLDLDVRLEGGRLHIHPASLVYAAGFTAVDFIVDASGAAPVFDLEISGEDIDIGDLLAAAQEPQVLRGQLSLRVDLQSAGGNAREIASNLNGRLILALEDGEIHRTINFLSAEALNLVLAVTDRRRYTDLNCLLAKLQFKDGVGEVAHFAMDTPRILATAGGTLNLAEETLDLVISPRQKRRLLFRRGSAVRVSGTLGEPRFQVIPLAEAAQVAGKILLPHLFLPERALGELWHLIRTDGNESPCVRAAW